MTRVVARNPAEGGRDWVVGDVHGCFHTLRQALIDTGFEHGRDRLFSVGDLINRGPNSIEALEWLDDERFEAVVTRTSSEINGACEWSDWSDWEPACTDPCASNSHLQFLYQPCAIGAGSGFDGYGGEYAQSRFNIGVSDGRGGCRWSGWSAWSGPDPTSPFGTPCTERWRPPKPLFYVVFEPQITADPSVCDAPVTQDLGDVCDWINGAKTRGWNDGPPRLSDFGCKGDLCPTPAPPAPPAHR